jgi:hypothetical protein
MDKNPETGFFNTLMGGQTDEQMKAGERQRVLDERSGLESQALLKLREMQTSEAQAQRDYYGKKGTPEAAFSNLSPADLELVRSISMGEDRAGAIAQGTKEDVARIRGEGARSLEEDKAALAMLQSMRAERFANEDILRQTQTASNPYTNLKDRVGLQQAMTNLESSQVKLEEAKKPTTKETPPVEYTFTDAAKLVGDGKGSRWAYDTDPDTGRLILVDKERKAVHLLKY